MAVAVTAAVQIQASLSFKKSESGYLRIGDKISFSVKNPKFFLLKGGVDEKEEQGIAEAVERRKRITKERKKREKENGIRKMLNEAEKEATRKTDEDLELKSFDTSSIDPVKKDISKWNWYVDDAGDSSEDDKNIEEEAPKKRKGGMKKKRGDDNNDEDWAGKNDVKQELISELRYDKRPRTRSISFQEPAKGSTSSGEKNHFKFQKRSEYEDDEFLGGFIVNDDDLKEEEEEEEDYHEDEEEED